MSQMLQLDALVTMLACLTTTQTNVTDHALPPDDAILENRKQEQRYALYDHFSIGSESEQYSLNVLGEYQGDASDALRQHLGKKFSTQDRDNDESGANCAAEQSAAFWYSNVCTLSNPFGVYQPQLTRDVDGYQGILWHGFLDGPKGSLKKLRILVRPRSSSG
ncbi:uncharacterized protein Dmoj_GI15995, partial [Drosophila mojavensis]